MGLVHFEDTGSIMQEQGARFLDSSIDLMCDVIWSHVCDGRCLCRNQKSEMWHQYLNVFLMCCSMSELFHRKRRITKHWNMLYKEGFNWARDTFYIAINSLGWFSENMRRQIKLSLRLHMFFPCSFFVYLLVCLFERSWEGKAAFWFLKTFKSVFEKVSTWCKVHLKGDTQIIRFERPKAH